MSITKTKLCLSVLFTIAGLFLSHKLFLSPRGIKVTFDTEISQNADFQIFYTTGKKPDFSEDKSKVVRVSGGGIKGCNKVAG